MRFFVIVETVRVFQNGGWEMYPNSVWQFDSIWEDHDEGDKVIVHCECSASVLSEMQQSGTGMVTVRSATAI